MGSSRASSARSRSRRSTPGSTSCDGGRRRRRSVLSPSRCSRWSRSRWSGSTLWFDWLSQAGRSGDPSWPFIGAPLSLLVGLPVALALTVLSVLAVFVVPPASRERLDRDPRPGRCAVAPHVHVAVPAPGDAPRPAGDRPGRGHPRRRRSWRPTSGSPSCWWPGRWWRWIGGRTCSPRARRPETRPRQWRGRHFVPVGASRTRCYAAPAVRTPLLLYGLALVVRALLIWHFPDPAYPDSAYYVDVARALHAGAGFNVDFIWIFAEVGGTIPAEPDPADPLERPLDAAGVDRPGARSSRSSGTWRGRRPRRSR